MQRSGAFGVLLFLTAAVVAGCGGGAATNALPGNHAGTGATPAQATMRIFIPQPGTASLARAPQYISANTKSVVITLTSVNGAPPSPAVPPTIFNISVPPCTAVTGGISCSVTVGAILGNDVFTIVAYDAANGTGNVLSSGTVTVAVGPGTNTPPPVALGGNVAKVVVTAPPSATPAPNGDLIPSIDGTVQTIQVSVAAYDASGNLIVGSAPFASPIPITLVGDPNGALTVSPTSVIAPNQNVVTLGTSGKMFYATPSPVQPAPTLATATLTFGPTGANGTTFTIDPLQFDLPSGGLSKVLPAPATTTIGIQEAGATAFTINAFVSGSTQTPFLGTCAGTSGTSPSLVPFTCTSSGGNAIVTLQSLVGGTGSLNVVDNAGDSSGVPFTALASQGAGGATLGYTVLLWSMPSVTAPAIPTSMTTGPGGQHLWVAGFNASTGGSVTAIPTQNLTTCTAATSPCSPVGSHQATLPQATPGASYSPNPGSIIVGGDGNLWYTDLGTNTVSFPTLGYFTASACIGAPSCVIPGTIGYGPGIGSQVFSSSPEAIADGGDGNIYMLFGNTTGGGAVSAASYSGFPSPTIYVTEALTSLAPSVTSPIAEGIVRGPDGAMWMSVDDPAGGPGPSSAIVEFSNCISGASFLCATSANTKQFPENETTTPGSGPYHPGEIVSVPAANELWFINHGSTTAPVVAPFIDSISSASTSYGTFGARIPIPNAASVSGTLLLGSDGNLWFPIVTTSGANEICRYTLAAAASGTPQFYCATIPPVSGISFPAGPMAVGPDGNIWFGLIGAPYIGEVVL